MSATLSTTRPSKRADTQQRLLREVSASGAAQKRLNAVVEAGLYKQIRQRALDEDRTVSEITRELWETYLGESAQA